MLDVELFGPNAEYETQCPLCGLVSGWVIFRSEPMRTTPNAVNGARS